MTCIHAGVSQSYLMHFFFIQLWYRELFKLSRYQQIVMTKNISWWKNISRLKNYNFDCESSQKFHDKQKWTTSVRCRITKEPPHEFANVHGARANGTISRVSQLSSADLLWHLGPGPVPDWLLFISSPFAFISHLTNFLSYSVFMFVACLFLSHFAFEKEPARFET